MQRGSWIRIIASYLFGFVWLLLALFWILTIWGFWIGVLCVCIAPLWAAYEVLGKLNGWIYKAPPAKTYKDEGRYDAVDIVDPDLN